jgi:hypothetical protein
MITAIVGRTFLEAFNEKHSRSLSPKEFFEDEYFSIFYDHAKYMQWVTNSPFVQMKKGQKPHLLSGEDRKEKLLNLFDKVENELPDASFALGFPASEAKEYASTSGQVSDLLIPTGEDEIYLSWIGSGLGLGVAGGYTLLFDHPEITLQTYEGWKVYRKYLNDRSLDKLRGNQINTWNGQWLSYSLKSDPQEDFDFGSLTNEGIFKVDSSLAEAVTVNWSQLFFSLSNKYPHEEMTAYVYGFGQTNKTIGFIPFQLKSGTKIKNVYNQLFGGSNFINKKDFESLFGIHIKRACELGSIGLQSLRPESLKKYMTDNKRLSFKNDEDLIHYQAYKTWLVAMLTRNKEEIQDYTPVLAEIILKYRNSGKGNSRITLVDKELFETRSKKDFINHLVSMISDIDKNDLETIKQLKNDVHLMTNEEFVYFSTLLKFDYTFLKRKTD